MKYWIGATLGLTGGYLLLAAQAHRARVRVGRAEAIRRGAPIERPIAADSLAALGEMAAPIVLAALGWFTLKICFAYYILPANDYFTLFDLAGVLALVAGYASWLLAKTHYRIPELSVSAHIAVDLPAQRTARTSVLRVASASDEAVVADLIFHPAGPAPSAQYRMTQE